MSRLLFVLALSLFVNCTSAQWGGRMSYQLMHYTNNDREGRNSDIFVSTIRPNIGFGIDHDPSDRSTIGLDFAYDVQSVLVIDQEGYLSGSANGISYNGRAPLKERSFSVTYRSLFCASSNEYTHFYFGPYLGVRRFTQTYTISSLNSVTGSGSVTPSQVDLQRKTVINTLLFPVGVRLGVRGALDGPFGDLFTEFGTQFGRPKNNPNGHEHYGLRGQFSAFIISIGGAWGFGGK